MHLALAPCLTTVFTSVCSVFYLSTSPGAFVYRFHFVFLALGACVSARFVSCTPMSLYGVNVVKFARENRNTHHARQPKAEENTVYLVETNSNRFYTSCGLNTSRRLCFDIELRLSYRKLCRKKRLLFLPLIREAHRRKKGYSLLLKMA